MAKKRLKYVVTITRTIEHVAEIEVDAHSEEAAREMAKEEADGPNYQRQWVEGDTVDEVVKVELRNVA